MRNSNQRSRHRLVMLLVGCGLWVTTSVARAGADAIKLVVQDPKSGVEFEVTEPAMLGFFAFANLSQPLPEAPEVGDGYLITRYWPNGPFDHFHYYPGTSDTAGYIFYDGFLQGWSDSDGKWYRVRPEVDQAMRPLLAAHGLTTQSVDPSGAVVLPIALGVSAVMIALAGFSLRRSLLLKKLNRKLLS